MTAVAFLDSTVATRWRAELRGRAGERRHWRTKMAHYEAVNRLLADQPKRPLRWEVVVAAVQPRGSRSTFYDVTGASATHPLITRYEDARTPNGTQIAYRYRRASAVDQLIDETKVHSFWAHRERWLKHVREAGLVGQAALADSFADAVREWAQCHPALAAALDQAPPACAVEDLTLIHGNDLPALRAYGTLQSIVSEALSYRSTQEHVRIPAMRHCATSELGLGLVDSRYSLSQSMRVLSDC